MSEGYVHKVMCINARKAAYMFCSLSLQTDSSLHQLNPCTVPPAEGSSTWVTAQAPEPYEPMASWKVWERVTHMKQSRIERTAASHSLRTGLVNSTSLHTGFVNYQ